MGAWTPPKDLDPEVKALCVAMNRLPGISTIGSCCGHRKAPFTIWFDVTDYKKMGFGILARMTCPRYYNDSFTRIPGEKPPRYTTTFDVHLAHNDINPVSFVLEGPKGSYKQANALAKEITSFQRELTTGRFKWMKRGFEQNNLRDARRSA